MAPSPDHPICPSAAMSPRALHKAAGDVLGFIPSTWGRKPKETLLLCLWSPEFGASVGDVKSEVS